MSQQTMFAERSSRQPQPVSAELPLIEMSRSAQLRQHAAPRPLIGQQRLQPAGEGIGAAGQTAGGGEMQAGTGQLPTLF
ncbi:hypothetical protein D3C73_859730 [compost metagenome]